MAIDGKSPDKDPKAMVLFSKRWVLAYVSFFGFVLRDSIRVSMSVAIVCMVGDGNATTISHGANSSLANDSRNGRSSCVLSDGSKTHYTGEFDWDKATQSIVLSSFFYGYLVTQVPGGWMASRFGGKIVYGTTTFVASSSTLLLPVAARWDYRAVAALRAVTGLSQAVTSPAMHAMLGRWAPKPERTSLSSFIYTGTNLGVIATFILAGYLCEYDGTNGWAYLFYVIGSSGLIWTALWFYIVSDTPDSHPTISKAERDYIVNSIGEVQQKKFQVPWMCFLKSRALWVMIVTHISCNWLGYTVLTGLPTFMKEVLKFDIKDNGILSSVPFMAMAVVTLSSGQVADFLRKRYLSTTHTRQLIQTISNLTSGACIIAVGFVSCDQRGLAVAILTIAVGAQGLIFAGVIVNVVDFAPRYAGILFGISNCISSTPGIVAPFTFSLMTPNQSQEEWRNVFYLCGGMTLATALVFGCFASGELEPWAVEQEEVVVTPSGLHDDDVGDDVKPNPGSHHSPAFGRLSEKKSEERISMENSGVQSVRL